MSKQLIPTFRLMAVALLLIALGFFLGSTVTPGLANTPDNGPRLALPSALGSELLSETERVYSEIYNRVAPAVVSIIVESMSGGVEGTSTGSGFVIDRQGHIVTNYHVVEGAQRIVIRMYDGTITRAEIIGTDPDSDLALIRVNLGSERLTPVPLGNSDRLFIGQTVLAIGNPFSNDWTLTSGIISALDRSIVGLGGFAIGGVIQTDAAINPGNSGGPLLNLNGEVIGVNSQIESRLRQSSGVGFAAPSNLVTRVVEDLLSNGSVRYSYIGIRNRPIDLDLIEQYNLPNNIQGVAIQQAIPGEPASLGGVRTLSSNGVDIITAIDGQPVRDFDQLIGWLAINTRPGQTVTLTVYRSGQTVSLPVTLMERPR